jgi:hypothetical protein
VVKTTGHAYHHHPRDARVKHVDFLSLFDAATNQAAGNGCLQNALHKTSSPCTDRTAAIEQTDGGKIRLLPP